MKKTLMISSLWVAGAVVAAGGATAAIASTGAPGPAVLSSAQVQQQLAAAPPAAAPVKTQAQTGKVTVSRNQSSTATVSCRNGKLVDLRIVPLPGWKRVGQLERVTLKVMGVKRPAVLATHVNGTRRHRVAHFCVGNTTGSTQDPRLPMFLVPGK
jgi:hypothetical protein